MTLKELTSPKIDLDGLRRAKNAFNISVVTAILFSVILVVTSIVNRSFTKDLMSLSTLAVAAAISIIGVHLSRRGQRDLCIILLIGSLISIVPSRVFVQKALPFQQGSRTLFLYPLSLFMLFRKNGLGAPPENKNEEYSWTRYTR